MGELPEMGNRQALREAEREERAVSGGSFEYVESVAFVVSLFSMRFSLHPKAAKQFIRPKEPFLWTATVRRAAESPSGPNQPTYTESVQVDQKKPWRPKISENQAPYIKTETNSDAFGPGPVG